MSITFHMQLYHDGELAQEALTHLRKSYPDNRVILISDGDDNPEFPELAKAFNAEYIAGERLMTVEQGGKYIQRMFESYLKGNDSYLLRMDPDSIIHRPLKNMPPPPYIYGSRYRNGLLQGGAILFTRIAAEKLYESGIFASGELADWKNTWGNYGYIGLKYRAEVLGLNSFDWSILYASQRLGIEMKNHPEICCTWKTPVKNPDLRYAFTHPSYAKFNTQRWMLALLLLWHYLTSFRFAVGDK